MSFTFTRLGYQGEIHITADKTKTLCTIICTHHNWIEVEPIDDKNALLCTDCKDARPASQEDKGTNKATKSPPKAKSRKNPTSKASKKAKEE